MRAACAWNDAQKHFGLADPGIASGHAEVARLCDLEAASERVAVNGGDERLVRVLDPFQQRMGARRSRQRILARLQDVEDLDVGAGNERRSGANQHDGFCGSVGVRTCHRLLDLFPHGRAQRIDGRVVDGDDRDTIVDVVANEGHKYSRVHFRLQIFRFET